MSVIRQDAQLSERPEVRLLDKQTINQIAAGEVVESPSSVVKELVENALDAGASRIEIELKDYGRSFIAVADNGCGMSEEDAVRALERHATSKIRSVGDLQRATTLGFRGEAIPSIASVSRMTISTGIDDGLRTIIEVHGGDVQPIRHASGSAGTTIRVEDLFFNTPARLRFLKSDATELRGSIEIAQRLALAHPAVAVTFRHSGAVVFQTPGDGEPLSALAAIWGVDSARAVVPVDRYVAGVRVRGFISPPEFTRATRAYQWIFVNGRPVKNRSLITSIEVAYRMLTPERRFPLAALSIEIDPTHVDANVSPTKTEVKFQEDGLVFDAVRHAIKEALMERGLIPSADGIAAANAALKAVQETALLARGGLMGPIGHIGPISPIDLAGNPQYALMPDTPGMLFRGADAPYRSDGAPGETSSGAVEPLADRHDYASLLEGLRIIGQTSDCFYILAENRQGLVIIDQHVAHERILFEMLCRERGQSAVEAQPLLVPETLHLDPRLGVLLTEKLEALREIGFGVEPFGVGTFIIRSMPAALKGKNPGIALREIVEAMADSLGREKLTPLREVLWITCACKMAIKAGDPLTHVEMEKLLSDLALTENPYLCPHGRPITIILSWGDLLRKFKRA